MKTLRQLRRDFLNDTKNHYNSKNRSANDYGNCKYYPPEYSNSEGCAIGRKIKDKTLCLRLDEPRKCGTGAIYSGIFIQLPKSLRVLGRMFLAKCQDLHDTESNWDDQGLSEEGKQCVRFIRKDFKL